MNFTQSRIIKKISNKFSLPMSIGCSIRTVDMAKKIMDSGADKIIINSICYEKYSIIKDISSRLGKQAVVVSIDVRLENDEYILFSDCGRKKQKIIVKMRVQTKER
mgnify:CR=1 FL=1